MAGARRFLRVGQARLLAALLPGAFAAVLAFAQPGLCPCWMLADARHVHPHPFAHPERPHDHAYLIDLFSSSPSQTPPILLSPRDLLAHLRSHSDVWSLIAATPAGTPVWSLPPSPPPPRAAA